LFLLTLTAPGEREHVSRAGKRPKLCPCTPPGGVNLAEWNATAGQRFNAFMTVYMRYRYGHGEYAPAAAGQHRGALHFHVMVRVRREKAQRLKADNAGYVAYPSNTGDPAFLT